MSILSDVLAAIGVARDSNAKLDSELAAFTAQEAALLRRPAHTDDIVTALARGLDNCTAAFNDKFARFYATSEKYNAAAGEHLDNLGNANLLSLSPSVTGPGDFVLPTMPASHVNGDISAVALTHFMKPLILPGLPAFVEMHFPQAKKGIRSADRNKQLAAIREKIVQLTKQKAELVAALGEARKAAAPEAKVSPEVALSQQAELLREAIADCDHAHGKLVVRHPDMQQQLKGQLRDIEDKIAALKHGERA